MVDVNAGNDPDLAWADERDDQFANGAHSAVPTHKRAYSFRVDLLGWLADQEIMAALDKPKTDTNEQHSDQDGGHPLGYRRPGDLIDSQGDECDPISHDRDDVRVEHSPQSGVGRNRGVVQHVLQYEPTSPELDLNVVGIMYGAEV
jgi:hypothetical protein